MARLDYIRHDSEIADRIRLRRGGRLTPLDGMLLHSPPVADGWNTLLAAIRTGTSLDPAIRELAILRVAVWNDAAYEWRAHEPVARQAGLGDGQLAALRTDSGRPGRDDGASLTAAQRVVRDYTDAMTRQIRVPDALFAELHEHFDDRQIVELTATIGTYNLVSRFLVALEVGEGEGADGTDGTGEADATGEAGGTGAADGTGEGKAGGEEPGGAQELSA